MAKAMRMENPSENSVMRSEMTSILFMRSSKAMIDELPILGYNLLGDVFEAAWADLPLLFHSIGTGR
jgi:hypothetical protein